MALKSEHLPISRGGFWIAYERTEVYVYVREGERRLHYGNHRASAGDVKPTRLLDDQIERKQIHNTSALGSSLTGTSRRHDMRQDEIVIAAVGCLDSIPSRYCGMKNDG